MAVVSVTRLRVRSWRFMPAIHLLGASDREADGGSGGVPGGEGVSRSAKCVLDMHDLGIRSGNEGVHGEGPTARRCASCWSGAMKRQ